MAETNVGKITQIIGAVLDVKFMEGHLPEINDAIEIQRKDGGKLTVEVSQHLGDDTVRCIAMGPTDGLVRGMDAVATGGPISVPVGEATLGRMFNVLGEPIDEKRHGKQSSVYAVDSGQVVATGEDETIGKYVRISHGKEGESLYGNLEKILVKVPVKVKKGQIIGAYNNSSKKEFYYSFNVVE